MSVAASGQSAGQTADGFGQRVSRCCCSPNKAFIARMCVHDPKKSRVTVQPSEGSREPSCMLFELDQRPSDTSELIEGRGCRNKTTNVS